MAKQVLYISYDGMTDPLGQSQVLPYLAGLSKNGYAFTIVSFEKPDRYLTLRDEVNDYCIRHKIKWSPLKFSSRPPILSKVYDIYQLYKRVRKLHQLQPFDLVHCRSYVSANAGKMLKKRYGVKFIFDIRGFWVDERVDGGLWNLKNPFYKLLYKFYKQKEQSFFKYADHIVTLTQASVPYLVEEQKLDPRKISVIQCATDFDLFDIGSPATKKDVRTELGITENKLVLSYLGSIGTWYLLEEMLKFFKTLKQEHKSAVFLFITPEPAYKIKASAKKLGIDINDLLIKKAQRAEVSYYMSATDLSIYFIKQCFSKISSSPTKLGEILAMGLPVITNTKIGDVDRVIDADKNGLLISDFSQVSFQSAVAQVNDLLMLDSKKIRSEAFNVYNLETAVAKYKDCYQTILDE